MSDNEDITLSPSMTGYQICELLERLSDDHTHVYAHFESIHNKPVVYLRRRRAGHPDFVPSYLRHKGSSHG